MSLQMPRETSAYGSQPLLPLPCYTLASETGTETVMGINNSIRTILYDSAGQTFIQSAPGTVTIITSAGGTTGLFSSSNPAAVVITAVISTQLTATSTVVVSGTASINFTGSGTVAISGVASVQLTATSTVAISGTATVGFSASGSVDILTTPVVGSQGNAWSATASVSSGATSNSIDLQYNYNISYFGAITNTATATMNLEVSQDDTTFYIAATASFTAGTSSPFHYSTTTAARYARLTISDVSAEITATIAGK